MVSDATVPAELTGSLHGRRVVIVGSSGIAARLASMAAAAGSEIVLAGRDQRKLDALAADLDRTAAGGVRTAVVDVRQEDSIVRLAESVGELDHLVSLAAAHAAGPVAQLDVSAIRDAFDAKVIGPMLLAKHFSGNIRAGGSILLFSGLAAWRPTPGLSVTATTNGAVSFLAEALAVELGPIRVNAISPGVTDSGYWDSLGEAKAGFFAETAERNPARRIGATQDIAAAALSVLVNPFITGTTIHVDGGARLA
ncbi:SDR family oxidoreductase [Micromonospora sp. NPDC005324]|uniref:SDR family oxidoreductase n=1 Tax=Micromonospora sp. NPDC005324 TaxID=3157033 RepID=UPI0033A32058